MNLINFATTGGDAVSINPPDVHTWYIVEVLNQSCDFPPRDGIELVSYNNELRMLGGWNGLDFPMSKKEDWKSIDGITWIQNSDPSWNSPRHTFIGEVFQNKIWVMLNDPYTIGDKSMYTYDLINGWVSKGQLEITDNQNLYFHFLHTDINNKEWIYFGGGQVDLNVPSTKFNNYLHRWDGVNLEKICDFPIEMGNRSNSIAFSFEGKIFIAGGGEYMNDGNHTYRNDIWVSEDDGVTFTLHGSDNLFAKQYANVCIWNNKIWYLDGSSRFEGGNVRGLYMGNDLLSLELVNGWGQIPPRHASGMCVHNDELYIVAGNLRNDSFKVTKHLI